MSEQEGRKPVCEERKRPAFSVSQFTTWHLSLEEDLELFKSLGIEGIEITERKLSTDPGKAREQLAMVTDAGIRVASVQPRVHALYQDGMCPDLEVPEDSILGWDLCLFDSVPPARGGASNEHVFAPRLDNLASCHAGLTALLE